MQGFPDTEHDLQLDTAFDDVKEWCLANLSRNVLKELSDHVKGCNSQRWRLLQTCRYFKRVIARPFFGLTVVTNGQIDVYECITRQIQARMCSQGLTEVTYLALSQWISTPDNCNGDHTEHDEHRNKKRKLVATVDIPDNAEVKLEFFCP